MGKPKNMTEITLEDGSTMETNLPAEAVADLQVKSDDQPKPDVQQASQTDDEQTPPAKADESQKQDEDQQRDEGRKSKPKPIAKLLEERHSLREENQRLKDELEKFSKSSSPVAPADVQELLEKYGVDETNKAFLSDLVSAIQKNVTPQLPKELNDLISAHQANQQAKAEEEAFKADVGRLQNTLKDELLSKSDVREKLQELAYSTDKAPDGEEYYKKPLYELYMNYVKPEVEPGRSSAEPIRGGSKSTGKVVDFAQIANDDKLLSEFVDTATKEQFAKFYQWQLENQKEPLSRPL